MKFSIFDRKPDGTFEEVEFDYDPPLENGFKMPMAHCDQMILHAPGECQYCDHYPEAQELRKWWRINFTGHHDPDLAPCPSTHNRSDELRDLWPGNTPGGFLESAPTSDYKPSLGERVAAKLMCPACLLPRIVPGHRFRGCQG